MHLPAVPAAYLPAVPAAQREDDPRQEHAVTTPSTPDTAPARPARLAVELPAGARWTSAGAAAACLAYALVLGWREDGDGVAVAAAFATALLLATAALGGVVPSSIRVGDVEVRLQQAREDGRDEGRVEGLASGTAISSKVATGELDAADVLAALHTALRTPGPLRVDGLRVPVPQLPGPEADAVVAAVGDALEGLGRRCTPPSQGPAV